MSEKSEVDAVATTVVDQTEAPPVEAAEQPEQPEKPVKEKQAKVPKEKKAKVPKEKKPKQPKATNPSHPPYFQMIKEALVGMNEKTGSSPYAIAKFMEEKHKEVLPVNFRKMLALQLKNSASKGKLIKIKASYKLSESTTKKGVSDSKTKTVKSLTENKKPTKPKSTVVDSKAKTSKRKSETTMTKKPVKKVVGGKKTKKATPSKAKQPKSIKSPAAKKAKKVAA